MGRTHNRRLIVMILFAAAMAFQFGRNLMQRDDSWVLSMVGMALALCAAGYMFVVARDISVSVLKWPLILLNVSWGVLILIYAYFVFKWSEGVDEASVFYKSIDNIMGSVVGPKFWMLSAMLLLLGAGYIYYGYLGVRLLKNSTD